MGPFGSGCSFAIRVSRHISKLRKDVEKAASFYAWYEVDSDMPDSSSRDVVLPAGGLAMAVVEALTRGASGKMWPVCQEYLKGINSKVEEANAFKC